MPHFKFLGPWLDRFSHSWANLVAEFESVSKWRVFRCPLLTSQTLSRDVALGSVCHGDDVLILSFCSSPKEALLGHIPKLVFTLLVSHALTSSKWLRSCKVWSQWREGPACRHSLLFWKEHVRPEWEICDRRQWSGYGEKHELFLIWSYQGEPLSDSFQNCSSELPHFPVFAG